MTTPTSISPSIPPTLEDTCFKNGIYPQQFFDPLLSTQRNDYRLLKIMSPSHLDIEESLTLAWEALDTLSQNQQLSNEEINIASSIVHKITCVSAQIKTIQKQLCAVALEGPSLLPLLQTPQANDSSPPFTEAFLTALKDAKKNVLYTLDITHPDHRTADRVLSNYFINLRNCFYPRQNSTLSLEELNQLTASLHKFAPPYCKLKTDEIEVYQNVLAQSTHEHTPPYLPVSEGSSQEMPSETLKVGECAGLSALGSATANTQQHGNLKCDASTQRKKNPPTPKKNLIASNTQVPSTTPQNIPSTLEDACFENEIYAQQFKNSVEEASGEAEERTHVRNECFSPDAQQRGNLKCDAYACLENRVYAQQFKSSARRTSGEAEERTHRYVTKPNPEVQQRGNLKCDAYSQTFQKDKETLSSLLTIMSPSHSISEKVLSRLWDNLNYLITRTSSTSKENLHFFSTTFHKLASGYSQLKSIEFKLFDRFLKDHPQKPSQSPPPPPLYTPEMIALLEKDIGLIR